MGTATMELKMAQDLDSRDHDPLLLVFMDLREAYYTLDQWWLLHTLEGYGADWNWVSFWRIFGRTKRWSQGRAVIVPPRSGWPAAPPRGGGWHHPQSLMEQSTVQSYIGSRWWWRTDQPYSYLVSLRPLDVDVDAKGVDSRSYGTMTV